MYMQVSNYRFWFSKKMSSQPQKLMIISTKVFAFVVYYLIVVCSAAMAEVPFEKNYGITYGSNHARFLNRERSGLEIWLDRNSGAGFGSKVKYGSGFFMMRMKLPPRDSAGVVTTFYLKADRYDELDFEFLGNRQGKPITLQTNVFVGGVGNREQRMILWFDPSADFHTYKILWNPHQIVFFVDDIPIRVYKNNARIGVGYPTQPMQALATIWDGDSWATNGGRTKIDWAHAPFIAQYGGFNVYGCRGSPSQCGSSNQNFWWNSRKYWTLSESQEKSYRDIRRKHLNYDYCTDRHRYPVPSPECAING